MGFAFIEGIANRMMTQLFPFTCPVCKDFINESGLCIGCWSDAIFIRPPYCNICGEPYKKANICARCSVEIPYFDMHRTLLRYGPISKSIIFRLKHGRQQGGADFMASMMVPIAMDAARTSDVIVPVPLHWTRLGYRGFNQSLLIARALSKYIGLPASHKILRRTRITRSQGAFSKHDRRQNVAGAFVADSCVNGLRVLLIDDVYTTGSTVNECASCLKSAGAAAVNVLTFAKT